MFDPEIDEILKRKDSYMEYLAGCPETNGKARIRCTLNGHELPVDLNAINKYMQTANYSNLQGIRSLIDNNPNGSFLEDRGREYFCKLTNRMIGVNSVKDIQNHINGKRFQKALDKHNKEKEKNAEEGSTGSDDEIGSENGDEIEARMMEMMSDSEEERVKEEPEEELLPVPIVAPEETKKPKRKASSTSKKPKAKKAKKG